MFLLYLYIATQIPYMLDDWNWGSATAIVVDQKEVSSFTLTLTETEGEKVGLTELEAFEEQDDLPFSYIRLTDVEGHFAYDYVVDASGEEMLQLHIYGEELTSLSSENYTLTFSNDRCTADIVDDSVIRVNCPRGESSTLTIASGENPAVTDSVYLQNPTEWQRIVLGGTKLIESVAYNGYWGDAFRNTVFYRTPAVVRTVLQTYFG